jgi:hypothetical protein
MTRIVFLEDREQVDVLEKKKYFVERSVPVDVGVEHPDHDKDP